MKELIEILNREYIQYEVKGSAINVGGSLDLEGTAITSLPDNLNVGGCLYLRGTAITSLPDNLNVGGYLDLRGTAITSLPDNLNVGGYLDLEGTAITSLPDNLNVGGSLDLEGTAITSLPDNLNVGGSLYLDPERINNTAYRHNCGEEKRTIFAVWVNSDFMIAAGCFLGTIEEFETAVDEKYSGDDAKAYKKSGRECVAELKEKLKVAA